MKLPLLACLILPLAACAVEREVTSTTIVSSVTPEQQRTCAAAAANAREVPEEAARAISATATTTGPVVTVQVGGETATCKLDELGQVEDVAFG